MEYLLLFDNDLKMVKTQEIDQSQHINIRFA